MSTKILAVMLALTGSIAVIAEAQTVGTQALSPRQRGIVPISAFTATGDQEKLKTVLNEGLDAGLTVNEIKEHLFADIFARDVLDWPGREITTISALAALSGTASQLRSHLAIAMNVGLTEAQMKDFIAVLGATVGRKEAESAGRVLAEVLQSKKQSACKTLPAIPSPRMLVSTLCRSGFSGGRIFLPSNSRP